MPPNRETTDARSLLDALWAVVRVVVVIVLVVLLVVAAVALTITGAEAVWAWIR